jgi:hypothetical protein
LKQKSNRREGEREWRGERQERKEAETLKDEGMVDKRINAADRKKIDALKEKQHG